MATRSDQRMTEIEGNLIRIEADGSKTRQDVAQLKSGLEELKDQMVAQFAELIKQLTVNPTVTPTVNLDTGIHNNESGGNNSNRINVEGEDIIRTRNRFNKMEFPKFMGEDVEGWLVKVEHYFAIDETEERFKVRLAVIHLEDIALLWHQSWILSRDCPIENVTWAEYKGAITTRFANMIDDDAMGALAMIRQTGTIQELCKEYDLALTKVKIPVMYAISLFLRAVKPEIGYPVKLQRPKTLPEAYLLARIQEEAVNNTQSAWGKTQRYNTVSGNSRYNNFSTGYNKPATTITGGSNLPLLPDHDQ